MELRRHYAVEETGRTQAEFFKDVEVGDRLRVTIRLSGASKYVPKVRVENLTQGTERIDGAGMIYNGLATHTLRELD
jgi:predicted butyrate kinase (DUF1464 family)